MPIYEYRRPDGTTFELQQTFSEDALSVDPDSGVPVQRVLHAPAVHFKGKGFYNTDYGTRNRQRETAAAAEKSSSEKSSSEKSSEKSSDGASAVGEKASSSSDGASSAGAAAKGEKAAAKPKKDPKAAAAKS